MAIMPSSEKPPAFDPSTCTIQGDVSRNDVVELCKLATGKRVVEFGMGGSTLVLGRCASDLYSYETDTRWYYTTVRRVQQMADASLLSCIVYPYLVDCIPGDLPPHDLLWIDGYFPHRAEWVNRHAGNQQTVVIHDSRGRNGEDSSVRSCLEALVSGYDRVLKLESVQFHPGDSNLVVVTMRREPVRWTNWNTVEVDGRANYNDIDFAP